MDGIETSCAPGIDEKRRAGIDVAILRSMPRKKRSRSRGESRPVREAEPIVPTRDQDETVGRVHASPSMDDKFDITDAASALITWEPDLDR
jgi:hypothetical protein